MRHMLFALFALLLTCTHAGDQSHTALPQQDWDAFGAHWYQGKAEITRFALKQSRYGKIRAGNAVQIFVTEDFLKDKQVKKEFGNDPADTVLKLNFVKKYTTGIYPYSIMTSVFSKVSGAPYETPKVSFTSQEWCGHIFSQVNLLPNQKSYRLQTHSYFQDPGDIDVQLPRALLEDEIWTVLRINPSALPLGEQQVIPSLEYSRLWHKELKPEAAMLAVESATDATFGDAALHRLTVAYASGRRLEIFFQPVAPFGILGWRETHLDGTVSEAVRTHQEMLPYWALNGPGDVSKREALGLPKGF